MIILGIDPGSRTAGYGVVEIQGKKTTYISSGIMKYDCSLDFVDRLGDVYKTCVDLVEKFHPDEIAIESLIYVKSVDALSKLAQARGAMIAAFMKTHQKKVFEYSPNLIKSSLTGHGHATKDGVEKILNLMFGANKFKTADESDALAIAVCHSLNRAMKIPKQGKEATL
jgi:crossover junction endodeoxyribonuclease RuvC